MTNLPATTTWFTLTPIGISVRSAPTFGEWQKEVEWWITVHEMTPIVVGDLLAYGERMWPEEFAQVVDGFTQKYSAQTLANYKSVMARVPPAVRREELSFGHYDAVASLPEPEQKKMLDDAVKNSLGREELRDVVRNLKGREGPQWFRIQAKRAVREYRSDTQAIVIEEPWPDTEQGQLPEGEVEATVRGI